MLADFAAGVATGITFGFTVGTTSFRVIKNLPEVAAVKNFGHEVFAGWLTECSLGIIASFEVVEGKLLSVSKTPHPPTTPPTSSATSKKYPDQPQLCRTVSFSSYPLPALPKAFCA